MTRRRRTTLAWIAILAMALQAPFVAAAAAVSGGDCMAMTQASHPDSSGCPCCPDGTMTASCCLGLCSAVFAIAPSPLQFTSARPESPADLESSTFFTRGDVPLIRPPIS